MLGGCWDANMSIRGLVAYEVEWAHSRWVQYLIIIWLIFLLHHCHVCQYGPSFVGW